MDNKFSAICEILNNNKVTYNIYEVNNYDCVKYIICSKLLSTNKESSMQIIFNKEYDIISLEIINNNYSDQVNNYEYMINSNDMKLLVSNNINSNTKYESFIDEILKFIYNPKRHVFEFTDRLDLQTNNGFKSYLNYDNIKYREEINPEIENINTYITFNRYNIPIKIIFDENDNLYELIILSKDIIDIEDQSLYIGEKDLPCIIISSLINYILKVNN